MIEAEGLQKRFGDVEALAGLDLAVPSGQVLAVLGPNGAGKTTLIRTIATLTRPTAGTLKVAGIDVAKHPKQVRRSIGLAGQYAAVEPALTGRENLRMVARLFGHDRDAGIKAADAVLDQMGLTDAGDRLVRTYSGGMQRRLDLGASLVGAPRLLLLDEPTTGLDPRSRNELWIAIEDLVASGTNVLLTTQYLDEADRLADIIAIIDHGKLVASGTGDELKAQLGRDVVDVSVKHEADLQRARRCTRRRGDHRRRELARVVPRHERSRRPRRRGAGARHRRHLARRHRPAASHARRRVPHPHRSHHRRANRVRRDDRNERVMTTTITAPTHTATWATTAFTVAARTIRKLMRTPQVFGIAIVQSVVFLLMFRYILGGAIGVSGVTYVEFLVPGFVVSGHPLHGRRVVGRGRGGRRVGAQRPPAFAPHLRSRRARGSGHGGRHADGDRGLGDAGGRLHHRLPHAHHGRGRRARARSPRGVRARVRNRVRVGSGS